MRTVLRRVSAVGAFGLVAYLALAAFRTSGSTRYAAAQKHVSDACHAFRAQPRHADADVCRYDEFGPLTFKRFHAAEADLDIARDAFARQEPARAGRVLLAASASAREMERQGTSRYAAKIVDGIVVLLEDHGADLDERTRRAIADDARLETATHPFQRERLQHLWVLAHYETYRLPDAPHFSPGELAGEMAKDEAAYLAMAESTLRLDVSGCEASARTLGRLGNPQVMALFCAPLAAAVRTRERLDRM